MIKKFKALLTKENITLMTIVIILLHPLLDMDYLMYGFLDSFGLPLPSTILHFVALPLLVLLVFFIYEPNRKKMFFIAAYIGAIYGAYFVLHHWVVKDMFELLYLTYRYEYSLTTELRYVITLIIPFSLIYALYRIELSKENIRKIIVITSAFISIPILVSNLFVFGPSTYQGMTKANLFTWFFGIYDTFHPRQLASQFYFSEGNTTGILLFGLYPIIINYYLQAKRKWPYLLLIIVQGLAMYVLATRVATFGAPLMLGAMIFVYLFLVIIKKTTFNWGNLIPLSLVLLVLLGIFPYTPAVVNQQIDAENDGLVLQEDYQREDGKDALKGGMDLIPGTVEYNYFYQYIFEDYYFLLTIPSIYYEWYYPYTIDPKFYVDLIFEYDLYERASGRQFQQIFFDYKWSKLDRSQKLFGFGYSRFMQGSIVLEQDFVMQKYTFGYLGTALLTFPWIGLLLYVLYKVLRKFMKYCNLEFISMGIGFVSILGSAYLSGHVLDQFFTTVYMAIFAASLLIQVKKVSHEA